MEKAGQVIVDLHNQPAPFVQHVTAAFVSLCRLMLCLGFSGLAEGWTLTQTRHTGVLAASVESSCFILSVHAVWCF